MSELLLPCAHCGGRPRVETYEVAGFVALMIRCDSDSCGAATIPPPLTSRSNVHRAWNARYRVSPRRLTRACVDDVVDVIGDRSEFLAKDLVLQMASRLDRKQVYNALGYLTRKRLLRKGGYGKYEVVREAARGAIQA